MPPRSVAAAVGSRRHLLMLLSLCLGAFLVSASSASRAPFLIDVAHDLDSDLASVANLISITAVSWGITSLVAGAASDRLGRKAILTAAFFLLTISVFGLALAQTFLVAVAWALVQGVGGGGFMGTVFATVSDHVAPARRGSALGWIITGQSLSLVLGVPLATMVGAEAGWRGAHLAHATVALLVGLMIWWLVPKRGMYQASAREAAAAAPMRTIMEPRILSLLGAGTMERICFGTMTVYLATFFLTAYAVPYGQLALALLLVTLGNLAGNLVGSRLADGSRSREVIFAVSLILTAAISVPLLLWTPGLAISIGLGFLYTFANALGRPSLMSALSAVPEAVRGSVLGLNVTFASVGWIAAAALGGWLIGTAGFGALGLFCASVAVFGALLVCIGIVVQSRRTARERAPAPTLSS
jgi:DHA1 family inner membrane transport protein